MIACPNCGTANPAGGNFCSNCGTRLPTAARTEEPSRSADQSTPPSPPISAARGPEESVPDADAEDRAAASDAVVERPAAPERPPSPIPPPLPIPTPVTLPSRNPSQLPASSPEWRMSDAGPLPEPRGRRRWLWILGGILAACLLLCVVAVALGSTVFRDDVESILATAEANATEQAGS